MTAKSPRRIVTGLTPDGRSTVLDIGPPPTTFENPHSNPSAHRGSSHVEVPDGHVVIGEIWAADPVPAADAPDPTVDVAWTTQLERGGSRCRFVLHGPNRVAPLHQRSTLDYDVVVTGQLDLVLEEGEVSMTTGDCVVLPGVRHGWRAGPDGATLFVVQVGL